MKKKLIYGASILLAAVLSSNSLKAQHAVSFDMAAVRNMHTQLNGINISSFYHFNKHISGGVEMNRFFPVTKTTDEETVKTAAWDFDLNFHYLLPLSHHASFYPVAGISHTAEKEFSDEFPDDIVTERFWSFNTGAGITWHKGRWAPHAEYLFTWGHDNQQFLLAGISYEFELGKTRHTKE